MNKSKLIILTTRILSLLGLFSVNAVASPYQFEVGALASQTTVEIDVFNAPTQEQEVDGLGARATYYLLPVDINRGPLAERAFLDKAAFVSGSFLQSTAENNQNTDIDTIGFDSRFVLESDYLFELGYSTVDNGSSSDDTTTEISIGRYLGNNATALLNYKQDDDGSKVRTLSGEYKSVSGNDASGTWTSSTISLGAIDIGDSTGFVLAFGGHYYPTAQLSFGIAFSYTEIEDSDSNTFAVNGRYFLTPKMFAGLSYAKSDFESSSLDVILLDLGIRF